MSKEIKSSTDQPFYHNLDQFLERTEQTLPSLINEQRDRSLSYHWAHHQFPNDRFNLFSVPGVAATAIHQARTKNRTTPSSSSEDQKISSLIFGILLMGVGAYLTVKSLQQRQSIISDLKNIQEIAHGIKETTTIFGRAIADIQEPIVKALSQIVTIQPKYCDAKIFQLTKLILSGIFVTISGALLIANHSLKKGWLYTASTATLVAGAVFGMLGFAFKDPRSISELMQLKEAMLIRKNVF